MKTYTVELIDGTIGKVTCESVVKGCRAQVIIRKNGDVRIEKRGIVVHILEVEELN